MFQEYQGIKSPEPNLPLSSSQQSVNSLTVADSNRERNISDFRSHNRLGRSAATFVTKKNKRTLLRITVIFSAVLRENDEETSDVPSSPEALPVSEKLLFPIKSDAVVRPEDSSQKRPTVLGLFASPEGNTHDKVSDSVFTSPEDVSSPQTNGISSRSGTEISASTNDFLPSSHSSEDLPLLPVNNTSVPADEAENDSDVELHETGSPEATTTTNRGGTLDGTRGETSKRDGVPKLRFCLPGKHGARGDRLRMWGRKHKRKRRPQQKAPSDLELTATNSMSTTRNKPM